MELEDICDEYIKGLGALPQEIGAEFKRQVMTNTPVLTGYLRSRWTYVVTQKGNVTISNDAPYAAFVEYGTYHMAPRAFTRRTITNFDAILTQALRRTKLLW